MLTEIRTRSCVTALGALCFLMVSAALSPAIAEEALSDTTNGVLQEEKEITNAENRRGFGYEIGVGLGVSSPDIDLAADNLAANPSESAVTGQAGAINFRLGGFYRASKNVTLTASIDASLTADYGVFGHQSTVIILGVGGVLGNLSRSGSFFVSSSIGPSFTNVVDQEIDNVFRDDFARGAMGEGIGFRFSVGRVIKSNSRWELSYLRVVDGESAGSDSERVDLQSVSVNWLLSIY